MGIPMPAAPAMLTARGLVPVLPVAMGRYVPSLRPVMMALQTTVVPATQTAVGRASLQSAAMVTTVSRVSSVTTAIPMPAVAVTKTAPRRELAQPVAMAFSVRRLVRCATISTPSIAMAAVPIARESITCAATVSSNVLNNVTLDPHSMLCIPISEAAKTTLATTEFV